MTDIPTLIQDAQKYIHPEGITVLADGNAISAFIHWKAENDPQSDNPLFEQKQWEHLGSKVVRMPYTGVIVKIDETQRFRDAETGQFVSQGEDE